MTIACCSGGGSRRVILGNQPAVDKYQKVYSIVALSILALLVAGGGAALLATSGGPNTLNLFIPGCFFSGTGSLSLVGLSIIIGWWIAAAKSISAELQDKAQNIHNKAANANISITDAIANKAQETKVLNQQPGQPSMITQVQEHESPRIPSSSIAMSTHNEETAAFSNLPNEVLMMILQHMDHRQRYGIARLDRVSCFLVSRAHLENRPKIDSTFRNTIIEALITRNDSGNDIQNCLRVIDCMNSWKFAEKRQGEKYIIFPYKHDAISQELPEQLINYVEVHKLIPLFLSALQELKLLENIQMENICDGYLPAVFLENNYPNKSHLKKIIHPQFVGDLAELFRFHQQITDLINRMNNLKGSCCGIALKNSDTSCYSNMRMLLDEAEENESVVRLFFHALKTLDLWPNAYDKTSPLKNIRGLKEYDLSIFYIDNPNYNPNVRTQKNIPNKSHLKKIINPLYRHDFLTMLFWSDDIKKVISKINDLKGLSNGIEFKYSSSFSCYSNMEMLLDEIEEKGLVSTFFQALRFFYFSPPSFHIYPLKNVRGLKEYDLSILYIDNPNYNSKV